MKIITPFLHVCYLISGLCLNIQEASNLPTLENLYFSVDTFHELHAEIQISEIRQTKKFRWFAYLPNPGYSPFTGGFTVSLNLVSPLQEIRLTHTQKNQIETIRRNNKLLAADLKNNITVDYNHIQNLISDFDRRKNLDSLNLLIYELAVKKYKSKEITPSEFIAASKAQEEFRISRQKEEHAIHEAINSMIYKAKMDVPASNAHQNNLTNK